SVHSGGHGPQTGLLLLRVGRLAPGARLLPVRVGIDPRQPDASSLRSSTVVHRHPQPETHRHSGRNTTLHARIVFNIVLPQYDEMKILCCWGQTVDFAVDRGDN